MKSSVPQFGAIYSVYVKYAQPNDLQEVVTWLKQEAEKQRLPLSAYSRTDSCVDVFTAEDAPVAKPMETASEAAVRYEEQLKAFQEKLVLRREELRQANREAVFQKYQPAMKEALDKRDASAFLKISRDAGQEAKREAVAIEKQLTRELQEFVDVNHPHVAFSNVMKAYAGEMGERRVPYVSFREAKRYFAKNRFDLKTGEILPLVDHLRKQVAGGFQHLRKILWPGQGNS